MPKHPKRPRDPNQLARLIVDLASGEVTEAKPEPPTPAAENSGRLGGEARARKLTGEQRSEIARKAASGRWGVTKG